MKIIKYFFQFIIIITLFIIFKIIGYKNASNLGAKIGSIFGPLFRSKKITENNIKNCIPNIEDNETNKLIKKMWENYGKIFSEYMYIKKFRENSEFQKKIIIENQDELEKIKSQKKPVIFISALFCFIRSYIYFKYST